MILNGGRAWHSHQIVLARAGDVREQLGMLVDQVVEVPDGVAAGGAGIAAASTSPFSTKAVAAATSGEWLAAKDELLA